MSQLVLLISCYLCSHLTTVESAKILGVFPIPSVSHQVVFQPIWKELSLRGHEVTVITTNPLNDPRLTNLTEIDMGFTYEVYSKSVQKFRDARSLTQLSEKVYEALGATVEKELAHPLVQNLIKNETRKFDVVLVEFIHPTVYAFSAKFNCPLIGLASLSGLIPAHDAVGNPAHPVLNPDFFLPYYGKLDFFDRLYSSYFAIWLRFHYNYYVLPREDLVARKYIGENLPYLGDIERNVSLLFLNTNPVLHSVRPNVPAIIPIGGLHIQKKQPLPKDLQKELDSATNGFVYFNLGSNIRSANMSKELRNKIIGALSEIPYKVVWKWEDDHLPNQPKNIIKRKWLPQQDILGHKNIKVFLTQGGLQSMEESITAGVPLVAMPFLADQPVNAKRMVDMGIAQVVYPDTLTEEVLKSALLEVAENPKYKERVKEISNVIVDEPMTGLEKTIWWIEYVIRHKGARHLRSPAVDMPWYQYLLLDVIGFVLCVTVTIMFVVLRIIKLCVKATKHLSGADSTKVKFS